MSIIGNTGPTTIYANVVTLNTVPVRNVQVYAYGIKSNYISSAFDAANLIMVGTIQPYAVFTISKVIPNVIRTDEVVSYGRFTEEDVLIYS